MRRYSEDQIRRARETDLAEFLRSRGETVRRSGAEYEWVGHHITLRGNRWYDQYRQHGGGAISFVQTQFGLPYGQAVGLLLGEEGMLLPEPSRERERSTPRPFTLPPAHGNMRRIFAYLLHQRGLDREVVYAFVHRRLIYEDAKHHNAVFVGVDEDGHPRHAHKRSTSAHQGSYRGNQPGSEAAFSFHWVGTSDRVFVFEGPIDLLAYITLHPERWREHNYVTLCSVGDQALLHQLEQHPHWRQIVLCLDNDHAGREAMGRIRKKLEGFGYSDVTIRLSEYKDWDEDLKAVKGMWAIPAQPEQKEELSWNTPSFC